MKRLWLLFLVALGSLLLFWTPFLTRVDKFWGIEFANSGMETIVTNFDGVNFLAIAKSWYNPDKLRELAAGFDSTQKPVYYSAHYPLTAGLVWVLDLVTTGPRAVMAAVVAANIFLAYGLYVFFAEFVGRKQAGWLATIALFLPARILSVRGVLSSETLFIPLTLLSLVQARKGKDWQAAGLGALAVLTRSPGIILFAAYAAGIWLTAHGSWREKIDKSLPYLLMPAALVGLWGFYGVRYGSFWAYFNSGDNLHLFLPPFRVFGTGETWISGMWREEIIYIYLLFALGVAAWWAKVRGAARYYPALFLLVIAFVSHRDIARYSLPVAPFVIAGFGKYWEHKWVKWIVLSAIVPIYLLGWQFVVGNVQPVADWTVLL